MTARSTLRTWLALALGSLCFAWHPGSGGVAHARTWTAHGTHFAPPSAARRSTVGPVRSHVARTGALVAPTRVMASPVRMHAPGALHVHGAPVVAASHASGTQATVHASLAPRVHMIDGRPHVVALHVADHDLMKVHTAWSSRAGRFAPHVGALGPIKSHPMVRPPSAPSHPQVRWPLAAGVHPMAPGAAPPGSRAMAPHVWIPPMVQHRSGRR